MNKERVLTDHLGQKQSIKWDGESFTIIEEWDKSHGYGGLWVIDFKPPVAQEIADFINSKLQSIIGHVEK